MKAVTAPALGGRDMPGEELRRKALRGLQGRRTVSFGEGHHP
jgi:hypothetical protein